MGSVGSPGTPVRRWYRVLGYIPGVLIGRRMCVTHAYEISGARRGGPCQKSGAHRHAQRPPGPRVGGCAWPIGLGRIPGGPKVPRGGAFVCISAISGVPGRGGNPQNPCRIVYLLYNRKICFSSVVAVLVQSFTVPYRLKKRRPWLLKRAACRFATNTAPLSRAGGCTHPGSPSAPDVKN